MESCAEVNGNIGRATMNDAEWGYFVDETVGEEAFEAWKSHMQNGMIETLFMGESWEKGPWIVPNRFPPNCKADPHAHNYDTVYVVTKGTLTFNDGTGWYKPGDVRWVRANTMYGPEEAGPEGCEFVLVSTGPIDVQWEGGDTYDRPTI